MKKSKLIAGILLMVLGLGISVTSMVVRHYGHGSFGMNNRGVMRYGAMGGFWFGGTQPRRFNVNPTQPQGPKARPNQGQNPNPNTQPNQNQSQGQNQNGGIGQ